MVFAKKFAKFLAKRIANETIDEEVHGVTDVYEQDGKDVQVLGFNFVAGQNFP